MLHNGLINIYPVANSVTGAGAMKIDGCWSYLSKSSQSYLVDLYVKKLNTLQSDMFYNEKGLTVYDQEAKLGKKNRRELQKVFLNILQKSNEVVLPVCFITTQILKFLLSQNSR